MSKRFIWLLIASIIFVTASFIVLERNKIEEPILIQLGTQHIYVNDENKYFSLSYITNHEDDVQIEEVRIGSETLYPQTMKINFYPNGELEIEESIMNEYTSYDLHDQQISLNDVQIQTIQNDLQQDNTVEVLFSNGLTKDYSLAIAFDERPYGKKEFSKDPSSSSFREVTTVQFTAKEDATIEQITSTFVDANIVLKKGKDVLGLPYKATAGEEISIEITPNVRLGRSIDYYININGVYVNGEAFADYFEVDSKKNPEEVWLTNYIEKVGGK